MKIKEKSSKVSYVQGKTAKWLSVLLKRGVPLDHSFFCCLQWAIGDLRRLLKGVVEAAQKLPNDSDTEEALKVIIAAMKWPASKLERRFDDIVDDYPCIESTVRECATRECRAAANIVAHDAQVHARAKNSIKKIFGISKEAAELCEFVHFVRTHSALESCFEDHVNIWKLPRRDDLARLLNIPLPTLQGCIKDLISYGLLGTNDYFKIHKGVAAFWEETNSQNMTRFFCAPLDGETLPLENFRVSEEEVRHVKALLSKKGATPVHIMLYGPPGTGKTTFARSLAKSIGVKAWTVNSREDDDEDDRRASLMACLNLTRNHRGAFILVDEAERLLDTSWRHSHETKDKAWLNSFLEQPDRRIVWVTNQIEHIDPAVRRRFSFSIRFEALGKQERQGIWEQVIARYRVKSCFPHCRLKAFVENYPVSAAVIEQAVNQAKELKYDRKEFGGAVERVLRAYTTLSRDGEAEPVKPEVPHDFNLDGICVEGSVHDLMDKCRRADASMRTARFLRPGCGTMLFYGPPGTGKTALARHIARELNRECLVTRASDLLSPYVGMAEQQIAEAFRHAEKEGVVLVVDEVDTFLYSRDMAQRSWEVSLVNEFLTALEECRGFCICTTNRMDNLDAAALRRFSHKVAFDYAKSEQVRALYAELLTPLCREKLSTAQEAKLRSFPNLTPGDFHAVRSQYDSFFSDTSSTGHEDLIEALAREVSLKAKLQSHRIGF
jgi:SpoVK/Ycf46/Vps4 family AAA+-type ATPase